MNHRYYAPVSVGRLVFGAVCFVAVVGLCVADKWAAARLGPAGEGTCWVAAALVAAGYITLSAVLGARQPGWGTFAWAAVLFAVLAFTAALNASVVGLGLFAGAAILTAILAAVFRRPRGKGGPIEATRRTGGHARV